MTSQPILDLVEISHFAAKHPLWVQGGGGNCSVKYGSRMAIKASGYLLEDVSAEDGYVVLELPERTPVANTHLRASMESPLHTFLGTCVIHTHPVEIGVLACAEEGRAEFEKLFPEESCVWIEYVTPGEKLFRAVEARLRETGMTPDRETVLILQNHGLFVSASSKKRCMELYQEILRRASAPQAAGSVNASANAAAADGFLTPDHAVYLSLDSAKVSLKQQQAIDELNTYSNEVLQRIAARGWHARFLSTAETAELLGMEEEKYRQNLWKKPK